MKKTALSLLIAACLTQSCGGLKLKGIVNASSYSPFFEGQTFALDTKNSVDLTHRRIQGVLSEGLVERGLKQADAEHADLVVAYLFQPGAGRTELHNSNWGWLVTGRPIPYTETRYPCKLVVLIVDAKKSKDKKPVVIWQGELVGGHKSENLGLVAETCVAALIAHFGRTIYDRKFSRKIERRKPSNGERRRSRRTR